MFIANKDFTITREALNVYEKKVVKKIAEISYPSILYNEKIYIPNIDTPLTQDNIGWLPKFKDYNRANTSAKKLQKFAHTRERL